MASLERGASPRGAAGAAARVVAVLMMLAANAWVLQSQPRSRRDLRLSVKPGPGSGPKTNAMDRDQDGAGGVSNNMRVTWAESEAYERLWTLAGGKASLELARVNADSLLRNRMGLTPKQAAELWRTMGREGLGQWLTRGSFALAMRLVSLGQSRKPMDISLALKWPEMNLPVAKAAAASATDPSFVFGKGSSSSSSSSSSSKFVVSNGANSSVPSATHGVSGGVPQFSFGSEAGAAAGAATEKIKQSRDKKGGGGGHTQERRHAHAMHALGSAKGAKGAVTVAESPSLVVTGTKIGWTNPFSTSAMVDSLKAQLIESQKEVNRLRKQLDISKACCRAAEAKHKDLEDKTKKDKLAQNTRKESLERLLGLLKSAAGKLYAKGDLDTANHMYTSWLETYGESTLGDGAAAVIYTNRAAVAMMRKHYERAASDCASAIALSPSLVKPYLRLGRSYLALGKARMGLDTFKDALKITNTQGSGSSVVREVREGMVLAETLIKASSESKKAMKNSNYELALKWAEAALGVAEASASLREIKAKSLKGKRLWPELAKFLEASAETLAADPIDGTPLPSLNAYVSFVPPPAEQAQHHPPKSAHSYVTSIATRLLRVMPSVIDLYALSLWASPGRSAEARVVLKSVVRALEDREATRRQNRGERVEAERELYLHLRKLSDDVDSIATLKTKGDSAYRDNNYHTAHALYTQALQQLETYDNAHLTAVLRCNRAAASMSYQGYEEAVEDCSFALSVAPYYHKAILRRARSLTFLKRFQSALTDFHRYLKVDDLADRHRQEVQAEVDRVYRKIQRDRAEKIRDQAHKERESKTYRSGYQPPVSDVPMWGTASGAAHGATPGQNHGQGRRPTETYYDRLGVTQGASEKEITTAYRTLAMKIHPDKHRNAPKEQRLQMAKKFVKIKEAYDILTDADKKDKYDSQLWQLAFGG